MLKFQSTGLLTTILRFVCYDKIRVPSFNCFRHVAGGSILYDPRPRPRKPSSLEMFLTDFKSLGGHLRI